VRIEDSAPLAVVFFSSLALHLSSHLALVNKHQGLARQDWLGSGNQGLDVGDLMDEGRRESVGGRAFFFFFLTIGSRKH